MPEKVRKLCLPCTILCAAVYVYLIWVKTGICFETNDDRYFTEILSGTLTDSVILRVSYMNSLLATLLSVFYRLLPMVPWYGAFLIFMHIASYGVILDGFAEACERVSQVPGAICCILSIILGGLYLTAKIQFTSTAALLAIAGYTCLFLQKGKRRWILFGILECCALLLRDQAMWMIQPLGGAAYIGKILREQALRKKWKREIRNYAIAMVCALSVAAIGLLMNVTSEEWRNYSHYNDQIEAIFDYYGVPAYDEVREILETYQVTENSWNAFACGTMLDEHITADCLEEVAAQLAETREQLFSVTGILQELWEHLTGDGYWRMNTMALMLWVLTLIVCLVLRQWAALLPMAGLLGARTVVWTYLIWRGRLPLRVTMPLFLAESVFLLCILWKILTTVNGGKIRPIILLYLSAALLFVNGFLGGRQQYRYAKVENEGQLVFMQGLHEVRAYCMEHPENRYLIESACWGYYTGSALETYGESNDMLSGGWFYGCPEVREYREQYLGDWQQDGVYFILPESGNEAEHPVVKWLREIFQREECVDRIATSPGGVYTVYHFTNS